MDIPIETSRRGHDDSGRRPRVSRIVRLSFFATGFVGIYISSVPVVCLQV